MRLVQCLAIVPVKSQRSTMDQAGGLSLGLWCLLSVKGLAVVMDIRAWEEHVACKCFPIVQVKLCSPEPAMD